ncbi:MAG: hypothetical protein V4525_15110 [Pseudomonadota bacterium]
MKIKLFILAGFSALLSGCVSYCSIPKDYAGSVVEVSDTGIAEGRTKAQFFVLAEVDGKQVNNSLNATRSRSHGQGFMLTLQYVTHQLPMKPQKVKLLGTHQTGAPIHEIVSQLRGTFFTVSGEVEFNPQENHRYIVTGVLKEEGSSIWIEDANTKERATDVVVSSAEKKK